MSPEEGAGDLAIVLHSHMPYVEGFGTYPFGEEWLFDAVIRSYLPVLEFAERLTMTVTPVLADQLEDAGTRERLRDFLVEWRIGAAEADLAAVEPEHRDACAGELGRYRRALELLDASGGDPLAPFQQAASEDRIAVAASAATHAVLPLLATREGVRLQLDAGIRSHRRRFGWDGGVWLPECAYAPGLEWRLAEQGGRWFCVDQSAHEEPLAALTPVATEAGPVALPIDWEAVSWLWALDGYPSDPAHAQFAGKSLRGTRIWRVGGGAYDPTAAEAVAQRQAGEFLAAVEARLREYSAEHGRRGLLVFAIDTELIGHWWSEGPVWLRTVIETAETAGVRLLTVPEALAEHEPVERPLLASTWGEQKDFRTWDSPPVADLAWAARRLELRLLQALSSGLRGPAALRAARELLAVQASDWAFLDERGEAGDYAFQRATDHAGSLLEAIDSASATDPCMRSLAPDLSLAPLLEP
ncbi:MAG TPA: 1,4-alpha-glucan branching protein domain-containing protein [Solirubrobacterales bacterium]|jgi:1,4-alpha-glucan branching enzyme|nr:1,4-alpha-glucan branching protein domain-containing protein [Solirubrobacterales bacterium]